MIKKSIIALFIALCLTACDENSDTTCGNCPNDQICVNNTCQPDNTQTPEDGQTPENTGRACGNTQCTGNQLCVGQVCRERNAKAEENIECDPQKFLESCDGNQMVTCMAAEDGKYTTTVTDCESLTCVLHATKNLVNCNAPDPACTSPKSMSFCYDMEGGFTSYLDNRECAMATDGNYYPFRIDGTSTDCEGGCRDDYSCGLSAETCNPETYPDTCDGDIAQYCDPDSNRVYGMNCRRYYNTQCIMTDGKADCDWENADYQ